MAGEKKNFFKYTTIEYKVHGTIVQFIVIPARVYGLTISYCFKNGRKRRSFIAVYNSKKKKKKL